MKVKHIILIGFALLLAQPFALQAQIPRTISYQGILTDPSGNIKPDGPYTFTFRLYDVSSGGTALWTETETNTVKDGLFSTRLGDQTVFPDALTFDKPYWLGIEVESEELSPRIALSASPYSFSALRADTAQYSTSATPVGPAGGELRGNYPNPILASNLNLNVASIHASRSLGSPTLAAYNSGTGEAGFFMIDNSSSSEDALYVWTRGTGYAGYFEGSVYTEGSYEGSDLRWKRNIAPINGALDKILGLRGVQFEWNRDEYPDKGFRQGAQIGLIAQEVEEVLPELVRTDQDGYKAVDYQKITVILVEAIKEQQKEIEALKAAVADLQAQSEVALQE